MLTWLFLIFLWGLFVGGLARFLVPGKDSMGLFGTWMLGIAGGFMGGFLGYVVFGADIEDGLVQTSGFIGSVFGSMVILLLRRSFVNR